MPRLVKTFLNPELDTYIDYYKTLGFEVDKKIQKNRKKTTIEFIIKDDVYKKNLFFINKYRLYKDLPLWVVFIFAFLIFAFATTFLLCVIFDKGNTLTWFTSFMVPCFAIVLVATLYLIIRYKIQIENTKKLFDVNSIKKEMDKLNG